MKTLGVRFQLLVLRRLINESDGQGLTEYALMLVLVVLVAIAALTFLGGKVTSELSTVATSVSLST